MLAEGLFYGISVIAVIGMVVILMQNKQRGIRIITSILLSALIIFMIYMFANGFTPQFMLLKLGITLPSF